MRSEDVCRSGIYNKWYGTGIESRIQLFLLSHVVSGQRNGENVIIKQEATPSIMREGKVRKSIATNMKYSSDSTFDVKQERADKFITCINNIDIELHTRRLPLYQQFSENLWKGDHKIWKSRFPFLRRLFSTISARC